MKLSNKQKKAFLILIIVVLILAFLISEGYFTTSTNAPPANNIYTINEGDLNNLLLTMIDVGQGDAFLLQSGGKTALVDCGPPESADSLVSFLKTHSIEKIDYLFGTHPHDDHMGGMQAILDNFEIEMVIIPEVTLNVANWYIDLMEELAEKEYDVQLVTVGNRYYLGNAVIKVIGPLSPPTDNLNNYSTVMKVSFGEMDILMTGDAEKSVENELLKANVDLSAEVLKVGHHGSNTSTSAKFLKAVNPSYALISCKVGNRYKHPTSETMQRFLENDIEVYRTDECGSVVAIITEDSISFCTDPGDYLSGTELEELKHHD